MLRGELLLKGMSEGSPRPLLNFHVTLGPATRGAMKNAEAISKTGAPLPCTPAHVPRGQLAFAVPARAGMLVVRPVDLDDRNRWMRKLATFVGSRSTLT